MSTTMKCPNCGLENRPDARFCKQCGQTLQTQTVPPPPPTPAIAICPACGATAKAGARFCPRCGNPLPAEPVAPAPSPTRPAPRPYTPPPSSPPPSAQPPAYAHPPVQPPPPARPSVSERPFPRWVVWAAAIVALICVVAIAAAALTYGPQLLGSTPTATPVPRETPSPTVEVPPTDTPTLEPPTPTPTSEPPPAFDAQVAISASAAELRTGDIVTVTVTVSNAGQVSFGSLRYQLLGEWEPFLGAPTGAVVGHEVDVLPGESDTASFILEGMEPGTAQIHANVTVDTREEPPSTRPLSSEYIIEISVIQ